MDPLLEMYVFNWVGVLTVIVFVLMFFTCRCFIGPKFGQKLMQYTWYKKLVMKHCVIQKIFFLLVLLHLLLSLYVYGNPFEKLF